MNMKLLSISTTTILFILTLILAITATFASAGPVKDAALDVAAKAAAVDALFKQNDHSLNGFLALQNAARESDEALQRGINAANAQNGLVSIEDGRAIRQAFYDTSGSVESSVSQLIGRKAELQRLNAVKTTHDGLVKTSGLNRAFAGAVIPKVGIKLRQGIRDAQGRIGAAQAKGLAAFS